MRFIKLSLLVVIGLLSQAKAEHQILFEELITPEEKLAPLDVFQSQRAKLFENDQAPVWCVSYCRAQRNQCELTHPSNYCIQEFGDCVDECLDPPGGGGGSGGGGGGEDEEPPEPV